MHPAGKVREITRVVGKAGIIGLVTRPGGPSQGAKQPTTWVTRPVQVLQSSPITRRRLTYLVLMTYLPQGKSFRRAPRVRLPEITPAVVRIESGLRVAGNLEVVSLTGGLLSLSKPLNQGSQVKLMFVTQTGPVLGDAEMLQREAAGGQAFKFTMLFDQDRSRLQAAIQSSQKQIYRG